MLLSQKALIVSAIREALRQTFDIEHDPVIETPPRRELGDLASPAPLHLARELKRAPRQIAEQVLGELGPIEGVDRVTIEGPGYLNFFLDRPTFAATLLEEPVIAPLEGSLPKVVVEHTNINPNKAAHIGHLRNAVLGDTLVSCLKALGYPTEVQNYIDDTGVQVADVVVGFLDLRGLDRASVEAIDEPFDYYCWDLYSEVGRWFEEDPERQSLRRETLHQLESGEGERAELGRLVARRVVSRHLATMARLDIGYDLLTRESEILRLHFFDSAFELLESSGAVRLEEEGKNAGCWVMPLSESEEFQGLEDPDKVIVRSDGTITYVGKDIAYQLWKFGLLGRDFEYRLFGEPWRDTSGGPLWETLGPPKGGGHPAFGGADRVVNVIDARQSYLQKIVRAGLEALGHPEEAAQSIHFAYEMVSLSESTARQFGFLDEDSDGEEKKSLEMSGRKGIGVKADDLIDRLIERSRDEISSRNRELGEEELDLLSRQIAVAALRYFMTKATTTRVIAFDLDEALSFEGDSGPYLQYSLVRCRNIQRKLDQAGIATTVDPSALAAGPAEPWSDDLWDLVLSAGQVQEVVARAAETLELSLVARAAIDLAAKFHSVYHHHPILREEDEELRTVRLAAVLVFERALLALTALLGIPVPEKM